VTIVVDTIKLMQFRWLSAECAQKLVEGYKTELDATSAVGQIVLVSFVRAALFRSIPRKIFRTSPTVAGMAVPQSVETRFHHGTTILASKKPSGGGGSHSRK
jgi:hypothetical protein